MRGRVRQGSPARRLGLAAARHLGTSPEDVTTITGVVPHRMSRRAKPKGRRSPAPGLHGLARRREDHGYRDRPGLHRLMHQCRIEDLRAAAKIAAGSMSRRPSGDGRAGLGPRQAAGRGRGLDAIFKTAGSKWREPGCSMCLAMNPDRLAPGERCASTSNRNFEGRQGYKGAPISCRRQWRRRRRSPAVSSI